MYFQKKKKEKRKKQLASWCVARSKPFALPDIVRRTKVHSIASLLFSPDCAGYVNAIALCRFKKMAAITRTTST
jgi:hypothetical protein